MNISAPFIQRPIATSLLMAAVFLVGLVAFPLLPVAPLPQVDFPTILVTTNLPGASSETMASSVATPLENQFAQIPGVAQMTSTSVLGSAQITIQFDLDRNIDAAAQDIQAAINAASGFLPKTLPLPPTYRKVNPAESAIAIYAIHSDAMPLYMVDDYAENVILPRMSQITGVGLVSIGGQQKPAIRVQVDPAKIAALGIQLEDVANVISTATINSPKGSINGVAHNYVVYNNDQLLKAAPWNDVIVAYKNGAPVRVRDIGVAVDGPENNQLTAWQNGKNGILLLVYKQPGANITEVVSRIEAALPQVLTSVPSSLKVDKVIDRTTTIRAAVDDVEFTLLLTIFLVVMVIFVFLRNVWATIIPGVTIPLALLGTCALMYAMGYTLDNLSLMGLTIAVGFVVDDAIVMLENIYRHIEAGMTPMEAAYKGASEIGFTILSISISLVAVFIPLLLMGGIIGRLFREFAITVTMTIVVSAFVSLTLTPMMCSRFIRDEKHAKHGRVYMMTERGFDQILAWYTRGLDFVLGHQPITLITFFITLAATVFLYVIEPKGFFPQQDTGIIAPRPVADAAQDVSFTEMVRLQHKLTDVVAADPDVESWATSVGGSRPLNNGFVVIALKPRAQRKATADQVITRLRGKLAQVQGATFFLQAAQDLNVGGRLSRTQYQYTRLQDTADLDELNEWAPKLQAKLRELPQLRDVATDQQTSSTMLSMTIDRDQAARFGIQPAIIDQTLYDAFGQRQVTQYFTQLNTYHVILEIPPELQGDPNTLGQSCTSSHRSTGQQIPALGPGPLRHPARRLSLDQPPGAVPGGNLVVQSGAWGRPGAEAVDAIQTEVYEPIRLPRSIIGTFQGAPRRRSRPLAKKPALP